MCDPKKPHLSGHTAHAHKEKAESFPSRAVYPLIGGAVVAENGQMLALAALPTAFVGPPPARMHATLPGVKDPSPYTIYSGCDYPLFEPQSRDNLPEPG